MRDHKQYMLRRKMLWALFGFLLAVSAHSSVQILAWQTPAQQQLYDDLLRELRCLVCANQSLYDSNAGLAKDLRDKTRELVLQGKSRDEIVNYMVQRYGEYVRYRPGFYRATLFLWLAPFCLVVVAAVAVVVRVKRDRS